MHGDDDARYRPDTGAQADLPPLPAHGTPGGAGSHAASPSIDYAAVLQILNQTRSAASTRSPGGLPAAAPHQPSSSSQQDEGGVAAAAVAAATGRSSSPRAIEVPRSQDARRASGSPGSATSPAYPGGLATFQLLRGAWAPEDDQDHGIRGADAELDATLGGFGRLNITASTSAAARAVGSSTAAPPSRDAAPKPGLSAPGGAGLGLFFGASQQQQQLVPKEQVSALEAAMAKSEQRQQQLEQRLRLLESSTAADAESQQRQAAAQGYEVQAVLGSLKSEITELRAEQARIRAELSEFTAHTTSLLTRIQTQIHQLFSISSQQGVLSARQSMELGHGAAATATAVASLGGLGTAPGAHSLLAPPGPAPQQDRLPLSRNLFTDLPAPTLSATPMQAKAAGAGASAPQPAVQQSQVQQGGKWAVSGRVVVPVSQLEDELDSLPSYSAMRRSTASVATTSFTPAAAGAGGVPSGGSRVVQPPLQASQQYGTNTSSTWASPPDGGVTRTLPSQFAPRTLGSAPLLAHGLAGAVAAAGGDLASLGIHLPTTQPEGGAAVGGMADGLLRRGLGRTTSPTTGFAGHNSSFGVLPEPMTFNMASDFKIVRVGNGAGAGSLGGAPDSNSMSLAAHTAAAMRQKAARGQ